MALDYRRCAERIYEAVGKKENLLHVSHCATRLRIQVKEKADRQLLEQIEGVQGIMERNDQLQIIIGAGAVNKVYEEFIQLSGWLETEERRIRSQNVGKLLQSMIQTIGDVFIPILPAIIAAGLMMGLLEALGKFVPAFAESDAYSWMYLVSNTAVVYLPVLVAVSSARVFGGNPYLGATVGLLLMHSDLLPSWTAASQPELVHTWEILGCSIRQVNYQGHVIPIIIAVWLMSRIETGFHKKVPEMLDLFVTPLVTVLVTAFVTMAVVGPFFGGVENYILNAVRFLLRLPFGIGAFLCGALYPLTVVLGIHHMFGVLESGMLAELGKNMWLPVPASANFAMCMACMAVFVKTADKKIKSAALPAGLSAALGITEPAIFGINLRFFKPLICGMIGSAFGAAAGMSMGVTGSSYGVTGIPGFLITLHCTGQYVLMLTISGGISFLLTWLFWTEERTEEGMIYAPVTGRVILQKDLPDETFAQGLAGKGIGILPESGEIFAPFHGTVLLTASTGHTVALKGNNHMKLLIHVGMDTVQLNGKGFRLCVSEGETVRKGQKILEVDLNALKQQGYETATAILLTNGRDFSIRKITSKKRIRHGEMLMQAEPIPKREELRGESGEEKERNH